MIARPSECNVRLLARMLDDSIGVAEQHVLTRHLDDCQECCARLEAMTAEKVWWDDTQHALLETTELGYSCTLQAATDVPTALLRSAPTSSGASLSCDTEQRELPAGEHWVMGLLDPSQESGVLGTVDSMPVYKVIGQGGMGVVLKARDDRLQRFLAIKLLSPMLATTGAARQRFLREAQAAAAVVHPNIVPIYAVSADRKLPYLVMPYVGGGNLQQYLNEHGPLPIERVLSIGLQVAEGLAAAHQQGIVHRDVKPANLMLDEGGFRVMLTDFGLARALDDATLTGSGMLAGTPQFMSPEQAQGHSLDLRSDIYSLGAVLYALATGRPPFRGDSTLAILRQINEDSPKPVIEINESYPSWFQALINKLMAKQPVNRIQHSEEVAVLLRACLAHTRSPHQAPLPKELQPKLGWKRVSAIALICTLLPLGIANAVSVGTGARARPLLPMNNVYANYPEANVGLPEVLQQPAMIEPSMNEPTLQTEMEWSAMEVDRALSKTELQLRQLQMELGEVDALHSEQFFNTE